MLTAKFVRSHVIGDVAQGQGFSWFFKLVYEFWGFCINGGDSLTVAGGIPSNEVTGTSMPEGFQNGTGSLVASGSDGYTEVGMPFFNTVNPTAFSASYVGKHLVIWRSGSNSTDDSIYPITQWINSSTIRVDVLCGGTPYSASLHPAFTTRNNINYRVIDFSIAAALPGYTTNDYLVLQFNGAPLVNPGQQLSQVRIRRNTTYNGGSYNASIQLSPSGSWRAAGFESGSFVTASFADPTPEINANSNGGGWGIGSGDNPAWVTLIGSTDFLIAHFKSQTASSACGFHIEIPQRLYPQGVDPNPITAMNFGVSAPTQTNASHHYGAGFFMHNPPDGTLMQYYSFARRLFGSVDGTSPIGTSTNGRYNGAYFNTYQNKFLFMDAILGRPDIAGQFQLGRVRLRRFRALPPIVPSYQRIGNNGEWIHITNGVLWPWDNALLPVDLLLGGAG